MTITCRVLMLYPKFVPNSFWNYTEACTLVGAKCAHLLAAAGKMRRDRMGERAESTARHAAGTGIGRTARR